MLFRSEMSKGHVSAVEMRLSIYGMEREEWDDLAEWLLKDWEGDFPGPLISKSNRWIIQIPRLWRIFRMKPGRDGSGFSEMLENIFAPLFEATLHPEKKPKLAEALKHIVGIDSVDDEGAPEVRRLKSELFPLSDVNVSIKKFYTLLLALPLGNMLWSASTSVDYTKKSCLLVATVLLMG